MIGPIEKRNHMAWDTGGTEALTATAWLPERSLCGMRRAHSLFLATVTVLVGTVIALSSTSTAAAVACPNEAVRNEQGNAAVVLPDCRAFELVSPSGSIPNINGVQAAANGERFGYKSWYPYPGQQGAGNYLLSARGASGWSTEDVVPPQGGVQSSDNFNCTPTMFYSTELDRGVLSDGWLEEGKGECEGDVPELVAGEPRGVGNLFLRDNATGAYELLDMPPAGVTAANALLEDITPDASHVLFTEKAQLTPEASPNAPGLYEWANGAAHFVTILPNKTAVPGVLADGYISAEGYQFTVRTANQAAYYRHAVSENGERVFFYANGKLYVRLNAAQEPAAYGECTAAEPNKACTLEVDRATVGAIGPSGEGVFLAANANGSRAFFIDESRLTKNANIKFGQPDLYEYDLENHALTDLTANAGEAANARGVLGIANDGSYIYFVAGGVLTGEQKNGYGAVAMAGQPNLYVRHAGATTFIATLKEGDESDWSEVLEGGGVLNGAVNGPGLSARVSPSGEYAAFESSQPLTGYGECGSSGCEEIFLYHATSGELNCVSCPGRGVPSSTGGRIAGPSGQLWYGGPNTLPRSLTDEGQVFFESAQPLVSQATNGAVNVYEYENGEVGLISSGTSEGNSQFLDASASGQDVFFATGQGLVAADTDNAFSVYDARVDGGFAAGPGEAGQAGPCESADACKPPLSEPPAEAFPASAAFSGVGNLTPPPEQPVAKKTVRHRSLTRAQKLARALKACHKKRGAKRRHACEARVRRRFKSKPSRRVKGGRR